MLNGRLQGSLLMLPLCAEGKEVEETMSDRACQFSLYEDGLPRCHVHNSVHAGICSIGLAALRLQLDESVKDGLVLALKLDDQARVIEELIALLQEAQAQWGEDYLWKKWGMSEELTRLKALSPTPTEPKEG